MSGHFRTNVEGKLGTETITGFATIGDSSTALVGATVTSSGAVSGTTITGSGALTGTNVVASGYIKFGAHKYLFSTELGVVASIVAEATAIDASLRGSLAMGKDALWIFDADDSCQVLNATGLSG